MSPDDSSPTRTIPISGVTSPRPRRAKPASLRVALSAPHRLFFAGGALQLVLATAWWLFDLLGRYAGLVPVVGWSVPAPTAHAFLFQYTIFPFFMFGFLLTAMANWTGIPPRRHGYVAAGLGMIAGAIAFQIGLALDARIALAALVLFGAGWAAGVVELARIAILNRGRDRYAVGVTVLMSVGLAGVVAFALSLVIPVAQLAWMGRGGGIWLFLLPVFLVVNHRLIPFFSSRMIEEYARLSKSVDVNKRLLKILETTYNIHDSKVALSEKISYAIKSMGTSIKFQEERLQHIRGELSKAMDTKEPVHQK